MINTCPKCKKEISYLINITVKSFPCPTFLNNQGKLQYEKDASKPTIITYNYICPECDSTLFTEEREVMNFFLS